MEWSSIDGIYAAYMTGNSGQAMAMFVFKDGKIGGADMAGLTISGNFKERDETIEGVVNYRLAQGTPNIAGSFISEDNFEHSFPISLPKKLVPEETHRIETPLGPLNVKFVKCMGFD